MFGLPQPRNGDIRDDGDVSEVRDNLPVVQMDEDSATLDKLLRLCYPLPSPSLRDLVELRPVLDAALKYSMDGVVQAVRTPIRSLVNEAGMPLRIYAISLRYNFEEEVRLAALCSLAQPIEYVYAPELEEITAGAYYRLLDYRKQCSDAAAALVSESLASAFEWIPSRNWIFLLQSHSIDSHECCQCTSRIKIGTDQKDVFRRIWWRNYMTKLKKIANERPCGKALIEAETERDQALLEASTCGGCKASAAADLRAFIAVYAAAVDRAVAKVILQIK